MSVVFLLSLVSAQDDPAEIARLLEYQYEQKLQGLKSENQSLKKQIQDLRNKPAEQSCEPASPKLTNESLSLPAPSGSANEERELYRTALKSVQNEDWEDALLRMEHFVRYFPRSELADNAIYWMAEIYIRKDELGLAREELSRILRDYPKGDRARKAQKTLNQLNAQSQTQTGVHQ